MNYALGGVGYWDADNVHGRRYRESVDWVAEAFAMLPASDRGRRILEIGGAGPWTELMHQRFPTLHIDHTLRRDLRQDEYVTPDLVGEFDVVVSMETMEHLHEDPRNHGADPWPDPSWGTGAMHMLRESLRILKPGGFLFLTTPNAASLRVLLQVVGGRAGMFFRPHYREYDLVEVREMIEKAGFEVVKVATSNVWRNGGMPEGFVRAAMDALAKVPGWIPLDRGECTFVLARKPLAPQAAPAV